MKMIQSLNMIFSVKVKRMMIHAFLPLSISLITAYNRNISCQWADFVRSWTIGQLSASTHSCATSLHPWAIRRHSISTHTRCRSHATTFSCHISSALMATLLSFMLRQATLCACNIRFPASLATLWWHGCLLCHQASWPNLAPAINRQPATQVTPSVAASRCHLSRIYTTLYLTGW